MELDKELDMGEGNKADCSASATTTPTTQSGKIFTDRILSVTRGVFMIK